jgi:hypothetical protein
MGIHCISGASSFSNRFIAVFRLKRSESQGQKKETETQRVISTG